MYYSQPAFTINLIALELYFPRLINSLFIFCNFRVLLFLVILPSILVTTFLFIYVAFNLLDGERGLLSYIKKEKVYHELIQEKDDLNKEIENVEKKIILLTKNIDLDYLEILYREKFFYGKSNEKVFLNQSINEN